MNVALEHFKHESSKNYKAYIEDILYEEGNTAISDMLKHIMPVTKGEHFRETADEHITRRHIDMTEEDMVNEALKTGKTQVIFAYSYDNPMEKEDILDGVQTVMWENMSTISKEWVYGKYLNLKLMYSDQEMMGYGIDENFNLVKSNKLFVALREDDDPLSKTGLAIDTCFPYLDRDSKIIKSREALMKEYNISDLDMKKFDRKKNFRSRLKENINQRESVNKDINYYNIR